MSVFDSSSKGILLNWVKYNHCKEGLIFERNFLQFWGTFRPRNRSQSSCSFPLKAKRRFASRRSTATALTRFLLLFSSSADLVNKAHSVWTGKRRRRRKMNFVWYKHAALVISFHGAAKRAGEVRATRAAGKQSCGFVFDNVTPQFLAVEYMCFQMFGATHPLVDCRLHLRGQSGCWAWAFQKPVNHRNWQTCW